jgi:nucleoside transporter
MNGRVRVQLSTMMFVEFFIWGVWYVTMGTYLGTLKFTGPDVGSAYSAAGWAAMISPFFIGMVADRFFAAQKVLGVLHLLGAVLMLALTQIKDAQPLFVATLGSEWAFAVWMPSRFFLVLLAYSLCYMPTLALVNAISFNQMTDPGKEFPNVRVLGTLGWIAAGLLIGFMKLEKTVVPMQIAAGVSVLMGVYAFFLPNTPPKTTGKKPTIRDILGLDALKLMKDMSFSVFIIASLLICIPLTFYYNWANPFFNEIGMVNAAGKQTMGQMSEVFFMLLIPFFLIRVGIKKTLLIGMLAWVVRYVFFAFGDNGSLVSLLYGGILLHGICYDFFFAAGQIYVDKKAPAEIRASAQGFIGFVTYGVGMVVGAYVAGFIVQHYAVVTDGVASGHVWKSIWLIPAAMAGAVLLAFALMFREKTDPATAKD